MIGSGAGFVQLRVAERRAHGLEEKSHLKQKGLKLAVQENGKGMKEQTIALCSNLEKRVSQTQR